jgi:hypothetical protein
MKLTPTLLLSLVLFSGWAFGQAPPYGVRLLKKPNKVDWSEQAQAQADKVYDSTLAVLKRENVGRDIRPRFTLVLGSDKDEMLLGEPEDARSPRFIEIHLKKWDEYKFSQGVIKAYCFELVGRQEVLLLARRATAWSDASVDVKDLK